MEMNLLKVLTNLEDEEQTNVKLKTLLHVSLYSAAWFIFLKTNVSSTDLDRI